MSPRHKYFASYVCSFDAYGLSRRVAEATACHALGSISLGDDWNQACPSDSPFALFLYKHAEHSHFPDNYDFPIGINSLNSCVIGGQCHISVNRLQLEVIRESAGTWLAVGLGHQVHHLLLVYNTPARQHVEEVIRPQFSHTIGAGHFLIKFGLHPFQFKRKELFFQRSIADTRLAFLLSQDGWRHTRRNG